MAKNADIAKARAQEAQRIRDKLRGDEYVVALEVKGKPWTTEQLAQEADAWRMAGRDVVLLVGGPDGLEPSLSAMADKKVVDLPADAAPSASADNAGRAALPRLDIIDRSPLSPLTAD